MKLTIAHSMFIDAPLAPGWYAQGREDSPPVGPFPSEDACERLTGIDSEGRAFRYETPLTSLSDPNLTDVVRERDIISAQPWYYQTRMIVELLDVVTVERDALSELCDSLQSELDELKMRNGEPL